jgi:hypothetical protein
MALQSTARRAEAPPKTASVAKANSAPDEEPVSATALPTRWPRIVAGKRTVASTNTGVAGRSAGAIGGSRERPANETNAAPTKIAQASQKDANQQVIPEDSNPPPQQGRPPAQRGQLAAGPAKRCPTTTTPQAAAPVVRTASAPRAAPANELSRDELRAYLSAVEAQVRAALRQVDGAVWCSSPFLASSRVTGIVSTIFITCIPNSSRQATAGPSIALNDLAATNRAPTAALL